MKLKEIVDLINIQIKTNSKIQNGIYNGLAKLVLKQEQNEGENITTAVIYSDGKEIRCQVDDSSPFNIYHRCLSISQVATQGAQYGDGEDTITETANMIAVVYSKDEYSCQEDLASILMACFPSTVSVSDVSKTIIKTTLVNNNSYTVFNQEYKSTDYSLNPEDYYFSIGYTVETTFDKSCVEKCC